jgi:hypothetical protein
VRENRFHARTLLSPSSSYNIQCFVNINTISHHLSPPNGFTTISISHTHRTSHSHPIRLNTTMQYSLLHLAGVAGGLLSFADLAMGTSCHYDGKSHSISRTEIYSANKTSNRRRHRQNVCLQRLRLIPERSSPVLLPV